MKRTLIIKSDDVDIKIYRKHLVISTSRQDNLIVAFTHIKECFINRNINLLPSSLLYMAKFFPVSFINKRGSVTGRIVASND